MFAWGGSFAGGRGPGPSAKATEASDMSNSVTAKIRFISILLIGGEYPGNSLDVSCKGRGVFLAGDRIKSGPQGAESAGLGFGVRCGHSEKPDPNEDRNGVRCNRA